VLCTILIWLSLKKHFKKRLAEAKETLPDPHGTLNDFGGQRLKLKLGASESPEPSARVTLRLGGSTIEGHVGEDGSTPGRSLRRESMNGSMDRGLSETAAGASPLTGDQGVDSDGNSRAGSQVQNGSMGPPGVPGLSNSPAPNGLTQRDPNAFSLESKWRRPGKGELRYIS
jgi:hypothetical protein